MVFLPRKKGSPVRWDPSFGVPDSGGAAAVPAAALALCAEHQLVDAGEADEHVDDRLNLHPRAEQLVDDVPVGTADQPTKAYEAPVEGADDDEDAAEHPERLLLTHREERRKR